MQPLRGGKPAPWAMRPLDVDKHRLHLQDIHYLCLMRTARYHAVRDAFVHQSSISGGDLITPCFGSTGVLTTSPLRNLPNPSLL